MIHRIKSQLGRISKEAKIEDELPLEPPEENAKLLRWVEQFIPSEHKAHVSARLKHLLLEKNAAECIWESTEASSGHVVVQRDVRQKRRGELNKQTVPISIHRSPLSLISKIAFSFFDEIVKVMVPKLEADIPFYLLLFDENIILEQEAKSFSIITERRLDGEAFEIETDSGELELPTKNNAAAQECAAYVLGSLLEGSMNLVKGNGLVNLQQNALSKIA